MSANGSPARENAPRVPNVPPFLVVTMEQRFPQTGAEHATVRHRTVPRPARDEKIMILSRHLRDARNRRPRTAAHVVAGALAMTAALTVLWVPAASAGVHPVRLAGRAHTAPAASHPGWVKYYIVRPPSHGHKEFLYEIAVKTLGNGNLATEIFVLNKGRLQPGGGRLETPTAIEPGWILRLPAKASGRGVHYGTLPVVSPLAAPSVTASPVPSAAPAVTPAGTGHKRRRVITAAPRAWSLPVSQRMTVAGGASLVVFLLAAGLAVVLRQRRKAAAGSRPRSGKATPPSAPGPRAKRPPRAPDGGVQWPDYLALSNHPAGPEGTAPDGTAPENTAPDSTGPGTAAPTVVLETAEASVQEHDVAFGDDRIHVVLAGARVAGHDGQPGHGHASAPYLAWTPLPYDIPDIGVAFACLGAGEDGCLFVDLAAAPGMVAIGGDGQAAVRLAESIADQLCMASAAGGSCRVVVIGNALPPPPGATWIAGLSDLESTLRGSVDGTTVVFCQSRSSQDMRILARYASDKGHPVVPVVLASLPDAPWSITARPVPQPDGADSPSSLDVVPDLAERRA